jgi:hypothetical protein
MDKLTADHFAMLKHCHRHAQAAHLPYLAAEEIENGLAALWILKRELDLKEELVENAIAHLQAARGGKRKR